MPTDRLREGGWTQTELTVETVFSLPTVEVRTATVQYEDDETRASLTSALGQHIDMTLRFLAGTRLAFDPPLPSGVTPKTIAPLLEAEARKTFKKRLRERGLDDVTRESTQRTQVGGDNRARVTKYRATIRLPGQERPLPLACWVVPWTTREEGIIITGGHPAVALADFFDLDTDDKRLTRSGEAYRQEFFSLTRAIE